MRALFAVLGGVKRCRYLGMYNEVVMLFQCCSIEDSLLLLYALAWEYSVIKNISVNAISIENTLLLLYALA